jgi:hypothetical protein
MVKLHWRSVARLLDCGDLDIGHRTPNSQVRPRTQSTITGGLGMMRREIRAIWLWLDCMKP